MFEPMGGSAPKYTGLNVINPIAAISAVAMLLEHLGEKPAADAIVRAIETNLREKKVRTYDLGGTAKTSDVGVGHRQNSEKAGPQLGAKKCRDQPGPFYFDNVSFGKKKLYSFGKETQLRLLKDTIKKISEIQRREVMDIDGAVYPLFAGGARRFLSICRQGLGSGRFFYVCGAGIGMEPRDRGNSGRLPFYLKYLVDCSCAIASAWWHSFSRRASRELFVWLSPEGAVSRRMTAQAAPTTLPL